MSSKRAIAVLAVLLGTLAAAPSGAAGAELCPPGVTIATYCTEGNSSGLVLPVHNIRSPNNKFAKITLPCRGTGICSGKLYFEGRNGKILGKVGYSIKHGKRAVLKVILTPAGKAQLEKTGKMTIMLTAVSKGVRSVIGHVTIRGIARSRPGVDELDARPLA